MMGGQILQTYLNPNEYNLVRGSKEQPCSDEVDGCQ
jgi:hypothetical protein